METKQKNIISKSWVNACRFILAVVFIFSGFVKAIDPLGFSYKTQEYLSVFGMPSGILGTSFPLLFSIALAGLEFALGVFLFWGIRNFFSSFVALLLLAIMTPLTLYLSLENPVSDCGCFGEAWVLTNWESFAKNAFLFIASVSIFVGRRHIIRFVSEKMEWMISVCTFLFIFALSFYCLSALPILDFRPYKIGQNIREGMEIPAGEKMPIFETKFVLEKDGVRKVFALEDYPDSTWTFIESQTVLKEKGYEPLIHDFLLQLVETGEDITDKLLSDENYTFLLVVPRIEYADDSNIDLINEIFDYSVEHGYGFYALTASSVRNIELWKDKTGAEYPFCFADEKMLKTVIRSNPGLLLMKDATILNKWSNNYLPDEYVLTASLDKLEFGKQKEVNDMRTIAYVAFWFALPLLLVLGVDMLLMQRKKKTMLLLHEQPDATAAMTIVPMDSDDNNKEL